MFLSLDGHKIIEASPRRKPRGPVRLDPTNPINTGLIDCLIFNEGAGAPINLSAPGIITTLTSSPTWLMGQTGPGQYVTSGSSIDVPVHSPSLWYQSDCTVRIQCKIVSWPGSFATLIDKSSGPSNRNFSIFFNTSGHVNFFAVNTNPGTSQTITTGLAAGGEYDLIITVAGTTLAYYVNGISKGTSTNSASGVTAGASALGRNSSTGGVNADAVFYSHQVWNRVLTTQEISYLADNPYGFLAPAEEMSTLFVDALGAVYLDPTQLGTNIVLSNLNLTATQMAAATANTRAIAHHSSGKYYCEFTVNVTGDMQVGICNAVMPLTEYLGQDNAHSIGVDDGGGWLGAGGTTTAPGLIAGHVYGLAININSKKAWIKDLTAGGNWNSDAAASPVTGVGGATFSTIT